MSHPFELTEDADPHVKNIFEHLKSTDQLMTKMDNEVAEMVGLHWNGNQATNFHTRMQEHLDHIRDIQQKTDQLATSSMQYIQDHRNVDA